MTGISCAPPKYYPEDDVGSWTCGGELTMMAAPMGQPGPGTWAGQDSTCRHWTRCFLSGWHAWLYRRKHLPLSSESYLLLDVEGAVERYKLTLTAS